MNRVNTMIRAAEKALREDHKNAPSANVDPMELAGPDEI